ncbi:hypothetical protein CISG_10093 [Coccidioides immitis RMSCC 3703]|uniref:Uncharacterized protein n=1 Tax=Coccidioides immitis RMSCC 3703 TaxID=454286 RepID=A0A0J8QM81_COCIT|nr:hypothetical protein CISG_10093 [Coccidioides immitis RMSCC 3703]
MKEGGIVTYTVYGNFFQVVGVITAPDRLGARAESSGQAHHGNNSGCTVLWNLSITAGDCSIRSTAHKEHRLFGGGVTVGLREEELLVPICLRICDVVTKSQPNNPRTDRAE